MNRSDISNFASIVEDKQQEYFFNGEAILQENFSLGLDTGDFFNIGNQETKKMETSTQKQNYQEQIQALVNQLKINEEHHAKTLKEYKSILADKDRLVEEKKRALERIHDTHNKKVDQLIRSQQHALASCQTQHNIEIEKLRRQLQQLETEAKGVAVEQMLNNFEQEQHEFPVDCIPNIPVTISFDTTNTASSRTTNKNTPFSSPLWPPPPSPLTSLRKSSIVYSKKG